MSTITITRIDQPCIAQLEIEIEDLGMLNLIFFISLQKNHQFLTILKLKLNP